MLYRSELDVTDLKNQQSTQGFVPKQSSPDSLAEAISEKNRPAFPHSISYLICVVVSLAVGVASALAFNAGGADFADAQKSTKADQKAVATRDATNACEERISEIQAQLGVLRLRLDFLATKLNPGTHK
jgi:hypothetical protein